MVATLVQRYLSTNTVEDSDSSDSISDSSDSTSDSSDSTSDSSGTEQYTQRPQSKPCSNGGDASASVNDDNASIRTKYVSVLHDATYSITLSPGENICSGHGSQPSGTFCPQKNQVAVERCQNRHNRWDDVSHGCKLRENTVCKPLPGSNTWGCQYETTPDLPPGTTEEPEDCDGCDSDSIYDSNDSNLDSDDNKSDDVDCDGCDSDDDSTGNNTTNVPQGTTEEPEDCDGCDSNSDDSNSNDSNSDSISNDSNSDSIS